jgi:hypothetical protein
MKPKEVIVKKLETDEEKIPYYCVILLMTAANSFYRFSPRKAIFVSLYSSFLD